MNKSKLTSVRYHVVLSFVQEGDQDGYQKTGVSHAETKEEAVIDVLSKYLNEPYPIRGIDVYEIVLNL